MDSYTVRVTGYDDDGAPAASTFTVEARDRADAANEALAAARDCGWQECTAGRIEEQRPTASERIRAARETVSHLGYYEKHARGSAELSDTERAQLADARERVERDAAALDDAIAEQTGTHPAEPTADDHSASRRVDVLREEAPHLLADSQPSSIADLGRLGCTGYVDTLGRMQHDGETCPVHEEETIAALRVDPLDPLDVAIDALEFRLEWLDDYADREYGTDAPQVIARYRQALDMLRADRDEPRTILVHINVEVPADSPATADDIADEIRAAIEIATDDSAATENMPGLTAGSWCIPLAEEI